VRRICPPNIESTALQKSQQRNIVAHHRLKMSTVRLEIIRGKAIPAHMCRNLPEALVGLVGDEAFLAFCDRLDSWLELLGAEDNRMAKRFGRIFWGMFFCMIVFVVPAGFVTDITSILLWLGSLLCVIIIVFSLVCRFTRSRPYGALSSDEIIYKIRGECADMTRQAPNLYFLVGSEYRVHVNHIDVSFTLLARLEIIKDKATSIRCMPAHMCRNLPAALEGLVGDEAFRAFCDRLDSWLELLGAEDNRMAKRFGCIFLGIFLFLILFTASLGFLPDNTTLLLFTGSLLCILTIHVSLVCRFTRRPYGALSIDEIMCNIRAECDNMTYHAPNLSFKVVMSKPPSDESKKEYLDYISVSASLLTQESGVASVPVVIVRGVDDTTIKIDNDENESDTDTEAETMSSTSSGDAAMEHV
jgi:hypothetical protein